MRNRIKRWLGISQLEESVKALLEKEKTSRTALRSAVVEELKALIDGDRRAPQSRDEYYEFHGRYSNKLHALIGSAADRAGMSAVMSAKEAAAQVVRAEIDTEAFIDSVVNRIRSKQLGGTQ